jgi:protocatechuate 3,4-dioxygenase beta subunit
VNAPETREAFEEIASFFDRHCRPLGGALVDVWHADDKGEYDNTGFRYRGPQLPLSNYSHFSFSATAGGGCCGLR